MSNDLAAGVSDAWAEEAERLRLCCQDKNQREKTE